ncbi:MAG: methyl-accepting chemotaxis protein [Desulfobulbaceae bacterium]|nr:methyl-accepting chemotaxis protein [Desulfobulbaceae bacterium]
MQLTAVKNWKIGTKIGLGFGLVLLLLLIVMGIYHTTVLNVINNYDDLISSDIAIGQLARDIQSEMLECRRNEKDFLLRKDKKYLSLLMDTSNRLISHAQTLGDIARDRGYDVITNSAEDIVNKITTYRDIFARVVESSEKMGLDHLSGHQGMFRNAALKLEEDLREHAVDDLYFNLLMLRRWEKDYLRTGSDSYKERLTGAIAAYKKALSLSESEPTAKKTQVDAIVRYETAAVGLINNYSDQAGKNQLYEEMRKEAHIIEDALQNTLIPQAEILVQDIRRQEKDYLQRHDPEKIKLVHGAIQRLKEQAGNSGIHQEHITAVVDKLTQYEQAFLNLVSAYDAMTADIETMRNVVHQVEPAVAAIVTLAGENASAMDLQTDEGASFRLNLSLMIGILSVVFGSGFAFFIVRSITVPINRAVDFSSKIAEGDLTHSLNIDQEDEVGILTVTLNNMAATLAQMIRKISDTVSSISASSAEMASVADQMASASETAVVKSHGVATAAEEMNQNMISVASAMDQASTNVATVAASIEEMNTSIAGIVQNTEKGKAVAEKTVIQAQQTSEQVNQLGRDANEINEVTETIKAISDKTNLLALNATIEAARAGDAGKGFAVVANEIKELAQQTADATGDIARKLSGIQTSTINTVSDITEITDAINEMNSFISIISDAVDQQSDATAEITENITQAAQGLNEINTNTSQTAEAAALVAKDIGDVSETANETSNSGAQVQQSANELSKMAEQLKLMVNKFKITNDHSPEIWTDRQ